MLSKRWGIKKFSPSLLKYHFCFSATIVSSSFVSFPKGNCLQTALSFSPCLQPCLYKPEPSFSQPRWMVWNSPWISSTHLLNWLERLLPSDVKSSAPQGQIVPPLQGYPHLPVSRASRQSWSSSGTTLPSYNTKLRRAHSENMWYTPECNIIISG